MLSGPKITTARHSTNTTDAVRQLKLKMANVKMNGIAPSTGQLATTHPMNSVATSRPNQSSLRFGSVNRRSPVVVGAVVRPISRMTRTR